jgi:hypothetical protein
MQKVASVCCFLLWCLVGLHLPSGWILWAAPVFSPRPSQWKEVWTAWGGWHTSTSSTAPPKLRPGEWVAWSDEGGDSQYQWNVSMPGGHSWTWNQVWNLRLEHVWRCQRVLQQQCSQETSLEPPVCVVRSQLQWRSHAEPFYHTRLRSIPLAGLWGEWSLSTSFWDQPTQQFRRASPDDVSHLPSHDMITCEAPWNDSPECLHEDAIRVCARVRKIPAIRWFLGEVDTANRWIRPFEHWSGWRGLISGPDSALVADTIQTEIVPRTSWRLYPALATITTLWIVYAFVWLHQLAH